MDNMLGKLVYFKPEQIPLDFYSAVVVNEHKGADGIEVSSLEACSRNAFVLHRDILKKKDFSILARKYHYVIAWRNHAGDPHRDDDLPALLWANGDKEWRQNGLRHRADDKPAFLTQTVQEWYMWGMRHRMVGPARISLHKNLDIEHKFFIRGIDLGTEENYQTALNKLKGLTDAQVFSMQPLSFNRLLGVSVKRKSNR